MDHLEYLHRAVEVSEHAKQSGNHPFGSILVDADGAILLEQGNVEVTTRDCTGHAETTLMRKSSQQFDKDFLANCTIYTTAEPCAMCAGAIYWANVRRLVYGITEKQLLEETGDDPRNPTLSLDCRTVFGRGQKEIEVLGPFDEIADAVLEPHRGYWTKQSPN